MGGSGSLVHFCIVVTSLHKLYKKNKSSTAPEQILFLVTYDPLQLSLVTCRLAVLLCKCREPLLAIKPLLASPPKPPSLPCIGNDWTLALNLLTPWGSVNVMTSLLVSAAQQETLLASPSSCSEKVLPPLCPPSPPFPCRGAGWDLASALCSAASRSRTGSPLLLPPRQGSRSPPYRSAVVAMPEVRAF